MIYTRLIGVLDEMEVKPIDVEGKEFDPSISEYTSKYIFYFRYR